MNENLVNLNCRKKVFKTATDAIIINRSSRRIKKTYNKEQEFIPQTYK
jgi:hypothetical protein